MQSENRIFDDIAKVVNGFAGTATGMAREAETAMRERMREFVGGMDFVSRQEFDAVKELAATARTEVELLKARLDAMEGKTAAPKPAAKKPAAKKAPPAA